MLVLQRLLFLLSFFISLSFPSKSSDISRNFSDIRHWLADYKIPTAASTTPTYKYQKRNLYYGSSILQGHYSNRFINY